MVNRKDFRPNENYSSNITEKNKELIKKDNSLKSQKQKDIDFEIQSRRSIKSFPDGEQYIMRADTELSENQRMNFYKIYNHKGESPSSAFEKAKHTQKIHKPIHRYKNDFLNR